jgi:hypothetical protein
MRVLVACEFSGTVRDCFAAKGHDAWSCDLLPTEKPGNHYQGDVFDIINNGWDLMIAHPPCTYMSKAGARWMYPQAGSLCQNRLNKAMEAKSMFMALLDSGIEKIAVENPVPLKIIGLPNYTQAIQPFEYGHPYTKRTLLWLKNLPILTPTNIISNPRPYLPSNTGGKKRNQAYSRGISKNWKQSSVTFLGIAQAMADQWG